MIEMNYNEMVDMIKSSYSQGLEELAFRAFKSYLEAMKSLFEDPLYMRNAVNLYEMGGIDLVISILEKTIREDLQEIFSKERFFKEFNNFIKKNKKYFVNSLELALKNL